LAWIKATLLLKRAHPLGEDLINIITHFHVKKNQVENKNKSAQKLAVFSMRPDWVESGQLDFGAKFDIANELQLT